ncbi:MAG: hypothetical protein R3F49_04360 [Planctomycetota bacterium]
MSTHTMEFGRREAQRESESDGALVQLTAPDVGRLTCTLPRGAAVAPGQAAGTLVCLGRAVTLVIPAGVYGVVVSERPDRVLAPVGFGDVVLELDTSGVAAAAGSLAPEDPGGAGLVVRADQSGRFYRRAAPDQPAFVEVGAVIERGAPIGLIEVMKTFSHVTYHATGGLPARARVTRALAADGADIEAGAGLFEVEPAP